MNLDDLKVIRNEERRSRRLTALKSDFYAEFKEYIDSLRKSADPQKKDELENALLFAEAIYDKRAAKIIRLAALAAKGYEEDASLTDAEVQIYEAVYDVFTHYRDYWLALKEPKKVPPRSSAFLGVEKRGAYLAPAEEEQEATEFDEKGAQSRVEQGKQTKRLTDFDEESQKNAYQYEARQDERTLIQEHENMRYLHVRVLADIPTFIGLDGENYKLNKGEIALLPEGNAQALSDRLKAIIIGDKLEDAEEGKVDMSSVREAHNSRS